ncbi:ABC transporter permease [Streptomyces kunmingensis]|uniref:Transport permease protein n=1 Tax=Streptomyces kunmingensis TaxID=68225 RepID=A0ABU6C301_9ACTN|nr:ABC transporter permease [Streptomyces kunmingensis]MEB3959093.1 ABC transporter permease [Streptomyces kunmingensis]
MTAYAHPQPMPRLNLLTTTRHCLTLGGRNLLHLKGNPGEILGFAVVQPLMVIALLVYVFGGAIAGDTQTYLQYALPGLLVQSSVTSVLATGTGLHQDISNGLFDRLRSLPIARIAPLIGHLIGTMVRVSAGLLMLLVVGAVQGFEVRVGIWSALGGMLLVALFAAGLAWLSMLVGLAARSATTVHMFSGVLAVPLTFCSNVFVKTDTMPGWLQTWADINPISQEATALRALMSGGPVGNSVWWTLGWTVVMTAVFAPLSIRAYRRQV